MLPPLLERLMSDSLRADIGPHERLEPDGFPLLEGSEYSSEHATISDYLHGWLKQDRIVPEPIIPGLEQMDIEARTRLYLAWLERLLAFNAGLMHSWRLSAYYSAATSCLTLKVLIEAGVRPAVIAPSLAYGVAQRHLYHANTFLASLVGTLTVEQVQRHTQQLQLLWSLAESQELPSIVEGLLDDLKRHLQPEFEFLLPGDPWSDSARHLLGQTISTCASCRSRPSKLQTPTYASHFRGIRCSR